MMRKLWLVNDKGVPFYFDYASGVLLSQLDGLGVQQQGAYLKFDRFFDRVKTDAQINKITGTLTFLKGYPSYSHFLDYIRQSQHLELHYTAQGTKFCYVNVEKLEKRELTMGVLQSAVTFEKTTPWLRRTIRMLSMSESDRGKTYVYQYPYNYTATFEGKTTITNFGDYKAPLQIEMIGAVDNPEITVYKQGKESTSLKLYLSSLNGHLIVDANPVNQRMIKVENGLAIDIYQQQDFTKDNFLFAEPGTFDIEFKPGVSSHTLCRITMTEVFMGH